MTKEKTWKQTLIDHGWPEEMIEGWTEDECEEEYMYALESQ